MADLTELALVGMYLARHGEVFPDEIQALVLEIKKHRETMKRLEAWAVQLDADGQKPGGVGTFIAAELRQRIKGDGNG